MPVIHLRIEGRVQGVGFRWFVREHAEVLGVAGWVRNTANGDVEVAARGSEASLSALLSEVGKGPPGSLVSGVSHLQPPPGTEYPDPFRITR